MKRHQAFTLIEMLVVMAIIAILAGILLPALGAARERSRRLKCMSNTKQVGMSLSAYLTGNDQYYPSYANYGGDSPAVDPYFGSRRIQEYQSAANYDRLSSRFLVIDYGSGRAPSTLTYDRNSPQRNFIPNGLGILLKNQDLKDASVLLCPSMSGTAETYYGHPGGGSGVIYPYTFDSNLWKQLRGKNVAESIESGDGTWLSAPNGAETAVALLISYSYRLQPWYFQQYQDAGGAWQAATAGSRRTVQYTKPRQLADYMCPPFKTSKQIGDRAILCDSFDYGQASQWGGRGMAKSHHGKGYNVLYADGSVEWYLDGANNILRWPWVNPTDANTPVNAYNDLTINGPQSQEVWHLFDQARDLDK